MIVALADDLTGAAEIAAIGWQHGLRAEIVRGRARPSAADLVVFDTDSRHCTSRQAAAKVRRAAQSASKLRPAWVFKKVDSVLRGNVVAEVNALQHSLGLESSLLVPCNPTAGRTIRNGNYYVNGIPIHKTDFRHDPAHPRLSARIADLLGVTGRCVVARPGMRQQVLPPGLTVGEATSTRHMNWWAQKLRPVSLPAGGAEFFTALLKTSGAKGSRRSLKSPIAAPRSILFVSGSLAESSKVFLQRCRSLGWPVSLMPKPLFLGASQLRRRSAAAWSRSIAEGHRRHSIAAVGIGQPRRSGAGEGSRLGKLLVSTVVGALRLCSPEWLCVEGGATAALLLQYLNCSRITVEAEFATGVVGVRVGARNRMLLVMKPGSYRWPEALVEAGMAAARLPARNKLAR